MTARLSSLLPYGASLLCAAMFPAAHWCPLQVTEALGIGAALLGALTGACMAREWWRGQLAMEREAAARAARRRPQALPRRELWTGSDREALAEIGARLPDPSEMPGGRQS